MILGSDSFAGDFPAKLSEPSMFLIGIFKNFYSLSLIVTGLLRLSIFWANFDVMTFKEFVHFFKIFEFIFLYWVLDQITIPEGIIYVEYNINMVPEVVQSNVLVFSFSEGIFLELMVFRTFSLLI